MQQAWLRNQACLPVQLLEPERGCEKIDGEGEVECIRFSIPLLAEEKHILFI